MLQFNEWWKRFREAWCVFWWGEPCLKHPGHRDREMDTEIITNCAMSPDMCSECFYELERELERKYGLPAFK